MTLKIPRSGNRLLFEHKLTLNGKSFDRKLCLLSRFISLPLSRLPLPKKTRMAKRWKYWFNGNEIGKSKTTTNNNIKAMLIIFNSSHADRGINIIIIVQIKVCFLEFSASQKPPFVCGQFLCKHKRHKISRKLALA